MATKKGKARAQRAAQQGILQAGFSGEGRNMAKLARGNGGAIKDDWRCGRPFASVWRGEQTLTDAVPTLTFYDQVAPKSSGKSLRHPRECPAWLTGFAVLASAMGRL